VVFPGKPTDTVLSNELRAQAVCVAGESSIYFGVRATLEERLARVRLLLDGIEPVGGAPILDAYRGAVGSITASSFIPNNSYVVLVTDGSPTIGEGCRNVDADSSSDSGRSAPLEPILAEIELNRTLGVRTFVLGAPDDEVARSWLSRAAVAGGTERLGCNETGGEPLCYLDLSDPVTIAPYLLEFLAAHRQAPSCQFTFPFAEPESSTRVEPDKTALLIAFSNGEQWVVGPHQGSAESCHEGYRAITPDLGTLCEVPCARLAKDCRATMVAVTGCSLGPITEPIE
jgi:hypothetical protein